MVAVAVLLSLTGCAINPPQEFQQKEESPVIYPDYSGITLPHNIAPMNFQIEEDGEQFIAVASAPKGEQLIASGKTIQWNLKEWHKLLDGNRGDTLSIDIYVQKEGTWNRYRTIKNLIAQEAIDPYLSYRLIEPLYVFYENMSLCQRDLTCFDERTLVIIKPDNWRCPSSRPGNIIDMLSRTGLRIVGCKVHRMSVNDALEFYGPVQNALRSKLAPKIAERARHLLEENFKVKLPDASLPELVESVGIPYADDQFSQLIEFMSGKRPENCNEIERQQQNSQAKCLVLIYEGPDAISKIRSVLGPTDPSKAPGGTVRRDFGSNIMVNTAHASDSPESVEREMKIIRIDQNSLATRIHEFLAELC